ncbi:MAG: hypothetical protein ACQEQ4_03530 [Fibrobacterota bacterium]
MLRNANDRRIISLFSVVLIPVLMAVPVLFGGCTREKDDRPDPQSIIDSVLQTIPEYPVANRAYEIVGDFFMVRDSLLNDMVDNANVRSSNLQTAAQTMAEINRNYPDIHQFFRTNSQGSIIAQTEDGEVVPRSVHNFRNVSRQNWFQVIEDSKREYYGYFTRGGQTMVFWNRPILLRNSFRGALSLQINLGNTLEMIAKDYNVRFEVQRGNSPIFSNLTGEEENLITRRLPIFGVPDLHMTYPEYVGTVHFSEIDEAAVPASSENTSSLKEGDASDSEADIAEDPAPADDEESGDEDMKTTEGEEEGTGDEVEAAEDSEEQADNGLLIFILVSVLVVAGVIGYAIYDRKKQRDILEAIEKGEI